MEHQVPQQQAAGSGDYGYDEAHQQAGGGPHVHAVEPRPAPVPGGHRPAEPDGDMGYDEAHDF